MKNKTLDHQIRECIKKISDEDLRFIGMRLNQRLGGDVGEAMTLINEHYQELNRVVSSASSTEEVYNAIDLIDKYIQESYANRKASYAR